MSIHFSHSFNLGVKDKFNSFKGNAKQVFSKSYEVYKKVNDTIVGNLIISAIRENSLEGIGVTLGMYFCQDIFANRFEQEGYKGGYLVGMITSLALGVLAKKATDAYLDGSDKSELVKRSGGVVVAVGTAAISSLVVPSYMGNIAGKVSRTVGAFIGSHTGAIVGGYIAVKIDGNSDALFNLEKPIHSYSIKFIQGNIFNHVLSYYLKPARYGLAPVRDLMLETIGFNAFTLIIPTAVRTIRGQLLNNYLPDIPQSIINAQLTSSVVFDTLGLIGDVRSLLAKEYVFAAMIVAVPRLANDLGKVYPFYRDLTLSSISKTEEVAFRQVGSSFNKYYALCSRPGVKKAHKSFTEAFIKWKKAKNGQKELRKQIALQAKIDLINVIASHVPVKMSVPSFILRERLQSAADHFTMTLSNLESQTVGICLTNHEMREYMSLLIDIHLPRFIQFAASDFQVSFAQQGQYNIRDTHQIIGKLLAEHYIVGLNLGAPIGIKHVGKGIVRATQIVGQWQIHHSPLRPCTPDQLQNYQFNL